MLWPDVSSMPPVAWLVALGSGGLMGSAAYLLTTWVAPAYRDDHQHPAEALTRERLQRLVAQGLKRPTAIKASTQQQLKQQYLAYSQRLTPMAQTLYGTKHDVLDTLLAQAGHYHRNADTIPALLAERLVLSLALGIASLLLVGFAPVFLGIKLMMLLSALYIGGALPLWRLKLEAKQRAAAIQRDLPDVMDLMVICVEAGLGLDMAIKRIARETQHMAPQCADEFQLIARELMAGLPRSEVFTRFAQRNQLDEIKAFASLIGQSDRMGLSVSQALRSFSEDLRTRRRQRAEESAAKASVKMTLPLVFFVFPPLMIILLGPMALKLLDVFGQGGLVGFAP
jgi:tight adherence protein C